jgi:hypothetical protein
MADTKITALTAIGANPIIPSTFPIPMVDLTDTSMAASGTTKKVTVNQILGAGGTATLASATITGNATAAAFIPSGSTVPTNGLYLPSANSLGFAYNSTLGMTLNSTGLLVGTTVANSKLTVASASLPTASWGIASIFSNDAMAIDKGGSLVFGGSFTGSTATYFAQIAGRKENSTDADVAGYLAFSTRPTGGLTTERLRIDSSGNVGIGVTPSAGNGCLQLVSGINFPATQVASANANTLDDYEEGNFTPVVQGSTTAGAGTYSSQSGRYTKTGRLVTVEIYLAWSAHTGSGNFQIGGLPFNSNSSVYSGASIGLVNNIALSANNTIAAFNQTNTSYINIVQTPVGGGAFTDVPLDTSGLIVLTCTYSV